MTDYPYLYRLSDADAYLVWRSDESEDGNEPDCVLLNSLGRLLTFRSPADLGVYAKRCGLTISPNVNEKPLDLDVVQRWLDSPRKTTVDCETFLNAWNLFSDLASTVLGVRSHIDNQKECRIYNKLFWGNNLPALTPPGKHYEPIWTKSEVGRMRNVLIKGLSLFRERL